MKKKASDYKYPVIYMEMQRNGDTLKRLADVIGMTRQTLVMKLEGDREWTISEIEKICKYYNKDYYELFRGE